MKAINDNGTIKKFSSVPKTWGNKIGLQYASDSELEDIGFYDVEFPTKKESQEYGDIEWDATAEKFTFSVSTRTFSQTLAELKEQKIANLKALYNRELAKTDWEIVRDQELGQTTNQDTLDARATLRSECATHESNIKSKTSKASVIDYELPSFI